MPEQQVGVPPWVEQVVIVFVNLFISFAVGCATQVHNFKKFSPKGPLISALSQFGLQPPLVFALCRAFGVDPLVSVGMLLCSTTPGGNGSNLAEIIFGGDVELGILCTCCSTLLAALFIPLNYAVYCVPLISTEGQTVVPWTSIISAVAILVVGTSAGCWVRYVNSDLGKRLETVCVKLAVLLLLTGIGLACLQTSHIWSLLTWRTWLVGMLLPPGKFMWSYALSRMSGLPVSAARTVAMEAGEQNIAVALAVMMMGWHASDERDAMVSGLMVYTLFNQAFATPVVTFIFWFFQPEVYQSSVTSVIKECEDPSTEGNGTGNKRNTSTKVTADTIVDIG